MTPEITFEEVQTEALRLGWDDVGITEAQIPPDDIKAYTAWLANHYQGDLQYMENLLRCEPQHFFPGAKTAIIFVTHYKQEKVQFRNDAGVVASYARGRDYHHLHRKRLKKFILWLENRSGQSHIAKGFSDSSPVLEKALAVQAGLGWFGKNTLLIHRRFGTFLLLSGLFTTLEFREKTLNLRLPRCGTCRRCLEACPTQAFEAPYILNATKCLSYHLIESKKEIPEEIRHKNPGYVFGCDVCQDVCPHNVRPKTSPLPEFSPQQGMGAYLSFEDMEKIEQNPEKLFGTPLQRRGAAGLRHTMETLNLQNPKQDPPPELQEDEHGQS
ncbi:tRNA epoxyqueuosine(34) reductase QueG [Parachlamydia sp. AcF125]|uniref:tRNA epoxyqueuosine(34) reductase QueG n=1 Tax=Parachlamydia sp. AcF125 TaxID=2795736 RepID=UPI001BC9E26A|nr:tRNA epoxyqueuosine(34) reductase QueG [Parachlamydia sp. AcF125]MBS4168823.1 Epoxyqueuosine reductase [Parachlamydia sp. AcF125]